MAETSLNDLVNNFQNLKFNSTESDSRNENQALECHARIVSFFAHKGGVSKTTNVHHIAYMLAKKYHFKVLMVDGDPQNNLTQSCCKSAKNDATWRDEIDRGTIYTALERLHYGMKDGGYILPANCVRLHKNEIPEGELWLLPGSLDLAKLEPQITFAHNVTNPIVFPLFDDIIGGFRHLFISTCAHYNIDFCLIDMGPSIGELNKSLFWATDYFVIPCSPDSYCKTTIKTMERTLPSWTEQQKQLARITADMTMPLNNECPKFLGIIMGLFQTTGKNKVPVKDSQHWMDIVKQAVKDELVPVLSKYDMIHKSCSTDYTLAEIPHFLSLMPIAQRSYCPVYDIPEEGFCNEDDEGDVKAMPKSEISRHKERAETFYEIYSTMCEQMLLMFNDEESNELSS